MNTATQNSPSRTETLKARKTHSERPAQVYGLSLGEKHSDTEPHLKRDQGRAEPH